MAIFVQIFFYFFQSCGCAWAHLAHPLAPPLAKTSRNSDKSEGEESKQEILRLPGKEIEISSKSNGCFIHFQNLCRVLKINLNEDEWKSLVQQPTSGDDKEVGFEVSFCESCSEIGKYLTDLFLELQRVKTQIKYCLGTISEKIRNSLDTPGGHLFAQVVFVDKLRKEIVDKCTRKLKEAEVTEKDEAKMDVTEFEEEAEEGYYPDESDLEGSVEMNLEIEDKSDEENANDDEVDEIYSPSGSESSDVIECEQEAEESSSSPSGNAAGNGVPATSAALGANTGVCGVANRMKGLPVVRFVNIAKSPSPAASIPIKSETPTSPTSSSSQTRASDKSDSSVRGSAVAVIVKQEKLKMVGGPENTKGVPKEIPKANIRLPEVTTPTTITAAESTVDFSRTASRAAEIYKNTRAASAARAQQQQASKDGQNKGKGTGYPATSHFISACSPHSALNESSTSSSSSPKDNRDEAWSPKPSTSTGGPTGPFRSTGGEPVKRKKRGPTVIQDHISLLGGDPLMYQCNICNKTFKTKANIKYHDFCKDQDKPFKCETCGQGFIVKSHYEYHIRTHTGERPYVCSKCGKGFYQRGKLNRHMKLHTREKPFVCRKCNRGFATAQALRTHTLIHTGERPFPCTYCDKRFTCLANLRSHVITHTGERPFSCRHCGKSFGLKSTLDGHLRTHSSERPYACDQCSSAFSNRKDLRRHLVIHSGENPFKCWICETAFRRKDNLERHIQSTHHQSKDVTKQLANEAAAEYLKTTLNNQNISNIPASRVNSVVIYNIIKNSNLMPANVPTSKLANQTVAGPSNAPGTSASSMPPTTPRKNGEIGKSIKSLEKQHPTLPQDKLKKKRERLSSNKQNEEEVSSSYCDKRFTERTNLKEHVITDTGERPFTCPHCGKSFGLESTLNVHLWRHSSERPHPCDQCSKEFTNSQDLRRHLLIHSGEKPSFSSPEDNRDETVSPKPSTSTGGRAGPLSLPGGEPVKREKRGPLVIRDHVTQARASKETRDCSVRGSAVTVRVKHENLKMVGGSENTQGLPKEIPKANFRLSEVTTPTIKAAASTVDSSTTASRAAEIYKNTRTASAASAQQQQASKDGQNKDKIGTSHFVSASSPVTSSNNEDSSLPSSATKESFTSSSSSPKDNKVPVWSPKPSASTGGPIGPLRSPDDESLKKKRSRTVIQDHITLLGGHPLMYQCNICNKKFKTKANIKYHDFCTEKDKPFKCETCGQGFITKHHYEYHLRTHTGERPYVCPKCGKGFNQRGKVTRHMRSHSEEKPFVCQECNRGFATALALRTHTLIHTGEGPFPCTYCDKRFICTTNLKKHLITHTGERPFTCHLCGKSFGLKWTLDLHLRTHSSERLYACDQCPSAFSNSKDLRRHLLIHSGEKPFQCWICGAAFARKDHLERHVNTIHNQ